MKPWSQDFLCADGHRFNLIIEKDDRDKAVPCETVGCQLQAEPTFSVPMPLRASFHDGKRREGFRQLAEASRLEAESYNLPVEKRADHNKEIAKLRKADDK